MDIRCNGGHPGSKTKGCEFESRRMQHFCSQPNIFLTLSDAYKDVTDVVGFGFGFRATRMV